ncbi:MFS transporter [Achromobacter sp. 2789STDY5608621]|uniref:MFS transporter n=1 Tax=Achromobacter sp. 2789STDY5608621 TaxID=1806496 RepID=UPI0006C0165E|nr:MFS transporter [Achromobacter sp. 2789STDY5608621]CUJ47441.1 Major Facilitator Superfamily [Achromobacter sp. 2789STDY5608621]
MAGAALRVVGALGTAQTLAWASSYYLPAMLAAPMARDLGIPTAAVYAAFSGAMTVSALTGPGSGRLIDRHGGVVLAATSVLFACGLALLGLAQGVWSMTAAWLVLGVAMGAGLYEAAFASLVRLYGHDARGAITGITLIAGFASTVGWPLSAWMDSHLGWRGACFGWAALHLLIGLPLNAWLPKAAVRPAAAQRDAAPPAQAATSPRQAGRATALLAFVFAATWFISTAMATHLPRLLEHAGVGLTAAVAAGALIGPAQVAGRLFEFGLLRGVHPLRSARLAALAHPAGVAVLLAAGPIAAPAFTLLHGAGNGILTIAKGTLPLALFGPQGYGARQGWLMMPARIAQALAPFAFGLALDAWGVRALWLSGAIGVAAWAALLALRAPRHPH